MMLARQAALLLSRRRQPCPQISCSGSLLWRAVLQAEPHALHVAATQGTRASSTVADGARQLSFRLFAGQHWNDLRSLANAYKQLSKFRLSALVVSTAAAGFVAGQSVTAAGNTSPIFQKMLSFCTALTHVETAGSGPSIDWAALCWTSGGTMMAAASANTLNQVREVWQDSQMHRTCRRPLPSGRVSRLHAVGLAATLGLGSLGVLATQVGRQQHCPQPCSSCTMPCCFSRRASMGTQPYSSPPTCCRHAHAGRTR